MAPSSDRSATRRRAEARPALRSRRRAPRLRTLYALVVTDAAGMESVLRRATPYGTMPWITDDRDLIEGMVSAARRTPAAGRLGPIRVVTFQRAEADDGRV